MLLEANSLPVRAKTVLKIQKIKYQKVGKVKVVEMIMQWQIQYIEKNHVII